MRRFAAVAASSIACAMLGASLAIVPDRAVSQTLYRWVDEKGTTHYTETPPPRRPSTPVTVQPAPARSDAAADPRPGKTTQDLEAEFQERQRARDAEAAKHKQALDAAEAKERRMKRRCAEARSRIERLQAERRAQLVWDEHRGIATERSIRAFDARGRELNRLGKFVDENCPPG